MSNREICKRFGKALRNAREYRRMTRSVLAERIGVSPKTIQSWEGGRTFVEDLSLLKSLGAVLGFNMCMMLDNAMENA